MRDSVPVALAKIAQDGQGLTEEVGTPDCILRVFNPTPPDGVWEVPMGYAVAITKHRFCDTPDPPPSKLSPDHSVYLVEMVDWMRRLQPKCEIQVGGFWWTAIMESDPEPPTWTPRNP